MQRVEDLICSLMPLPSQDHSRGKMGSKKKKIQKSEVAISSEKLDLPSELV